MNGVYDARAAPRSDAVNGLRVLQVRVHARLFVQKPRAQMLRCMFSIASITDYLPRSDERRDFYAQAHQVAAMVREIVRVRHPVALNVRSRRVLRVRPPIVAFRKEIMRAACAARACGCSDSNGRL